MSQVADFLVELGTEELPPKSLAKLATAFHNALVERFEESELTFTSSEWFATPRRLAVRIQSLKTQQDDKMVERQGPAVAAAYDKDGNPKPAAIGFAKSCGVEVDQLEKIETPKGERLAYKAEVKGETAESLVPGIIEFAISKLPIPKAMRWGDSNAEFIRPPHWLVVLLGNKVVETELLELNAGNQSMGHRFHSQGPITITQPSDYEKALEQAKVIADFEQRKSMIRDQVESIAKDLKANAVIEDDLLNEVAALVEWPVALAGKFDDSFLEVPAEALIATMQADQKYFHFVDNEGNLLPRFVTISNIKSSRPETVVEGNERVIRPRLADAKFFYDTDKKVRLDSYREKLKTIVFQNKLGTLFDKTERISNIAHQIAEKTSASSDDARRAAELCKCDLMTNMVYEFPELQGIMGRYYAKHDGESDEVSASMDEIYMPRFAGDELPKTKTGIAIALADRMDTIVGIFGIGQAPTGAKDPFALRRAALGVLRILVEREIALDLSDLIELALNNLKGIELEKDTQQHVLEFFEARLAAWYQDKGYSAQVIKSVTALQTSQPFDIDKRIKAVNHFNQLDASESLAAANKRVANILAKSDVDLDSLSLDTDLLQDDAEHQLYQKLDNVKAETLKLVKASQYQQALTNLADLKDVTDNFFDNVMVNAEDEKIRNNRLALLQTLRGLFLSIADISLLQK